MSARRWEWERSGRAANVLAVALADLELDLDVFAGPFDLLLTLILREEVDLLEVDLADVVITYIDHLERQLDDSSAALSGEAGRRARGEDEQLDLEAATEFLVLIAALLELKSRLLLPGEELQEIELDPGEAAEELLARLLAAHRYRAAAAHLRERLESEQGHRFRSAPPPPQLRKASLPDASAVYDPALLTAAIGDLLAVPPPVDLRHVTVAKVTVAERLVHLRALLRRGRFTFSEAVARSDRVTVAVTLYALLELYKQGEATWTQDEPFAEITIESLAGLERATA
jgi:segregation and condensation protein A